MNSFVGFSKSKSIFSKLIQLFQDGLGHAFFAFEYHGKWYVVDSSRYGIKIRSMEAFKGHATLVKKYEMHSEYDQIRKIFVMCTERSYDKYPMFEIVGNAWQIIVKLITFGKLKIKNPFQGGDRYPRCHEWVAILLRDVYGHDFKNVDFDNTDLLWFDDYCEKKWRK